MKLLVPIDFTPITRNALDYAVELTKTLGGDIELLHIVAKDSEQEAAKERLRTIIAELMPEDQKLVGCRVVTGSIFKDIASAAEDGNARLLVMGTHGAKGLQKIFGSYAIKVVTSAKTPFIITQSRKPQGKIVKIVMPVDLSKESVQIVKVVAELAKKFQAQIHVVCKHESDEWLAKKVKINISSAKLVLNDEKVPYEIVTLPGKSSLENEVQEYGDKVGVGLYAITHFSESILPQFDTFSQEMITNETGIPVLIMNAQQMNNVNSQFTFITI